MSARWATPQTTSSPPGKLWHGAVAAPRATVADVAVQQGPPAEPTPDDIPGLDPYLRWAEHTHWQGMKVQGGWGRDDSVEEIVQIVVRADNNTAREQLLDVKGPCADLLAVPDVYREAVIPGTRHALHFTAWVKRSDIARLRTTTLPAVWELSQPRRDAERVARGSAIGRFGPQREVIDFAARNVLNDAIASADCSKPADLLSDVIAVIDVGCPFLNTRFAPAKRVAATRVARLWDQGGDLLHPGDPRAGPGWPWTRPVKMGYGREIHPNRLQAMAQRVHQAPDAQAPAIDEATAYRGIDYLIDYDDPRRRISYATHGGHVLDMAGGTRDPLTGEIDAAGEAALVFVQLPSLTAADSSGASLASHLLDAVRYVLDQCTPDARVVVNISYGSFAGPHDGHSLIESALDELLDKRRNDFSIVLAAGNARQKCCHAQRTVRKDRSALLRVALAGGDTTDTFVECWYPTQLPAGWQMTARVRGPNREWSPPVAAGGQALQLDLAAEREVIAMLCHEARPPNGKDKALVLLALAPTAQPSGVPCALADAGSWEIELMLDPIEPYQGKHPAESPDVVVQAWIERDDPGQNEGAAPHAFYDQDGDDDMNTFSSLATGTHTVLAGGFRLGDGRPAAYSSVGPQRDGDKALPLVLAACEEDEVQPDLCATAVRSGDTWRMAGTSVAAPVLARRLYNTMQHRRVGRTEWRDVLLHLADGKTDAFVRLPPPPEG